MGPVSPPPRPHVSANHCHSGTPRIRAKYDTGAAACGFGSFSAKSPKPTSDPFGGPTYIGNSPTFR